MLNLIVGSPNQMHKHGVLANEKERNAARGPSRRNHGKLCGRRKRKKGRLASKDFLTLGLASPTSYQARYAAYGGAGFEGSQSIA